MFKHSVTWHGKCSSTQQHGMENVQALSDMACQQIHILTPVESTVTKALETE
jgi:hypothetical protein